MSLDMRDSLTDEIRNPHKIWHHLKQNNPHDLAISPPVSIEIQPTSTCNLRCKWCSYWDRNGFGTQNGQSLPDIVISRILNFVEKYQVKGIYLSGGGEPCTYGKIADLIKELHKRNAALAMITNGTLFARKALQVAHLLSYIQISLINPQSENYANITSSKKGFSPMQALPGQIKAFYKEDSPLIGGMYVLTEWNYEDAFEVINFCQKNHFDYCSFRIAVDFEKRGVNFSEQAQQYLSDGLSRYPQFNSGYTNLKKVLSFSKDQGYTPSRCINIHQGLTCTINPKGEIFLCIPDVGKEALCIGSLQTHDFEEIWGGKTHQQVVDKLSNRYCNGKCHRACRVHSYNAAFHKGPPDVLPTFHTAFL